MYYRLYLNKISMNRRLDAVLHLLNLNNVGTTYSTTHCHVFPSITISLRVKPYRKEVSIGIIVCK